jgi:murein L,D-transpeptidase YafK
MLQRLQNNYQNVTKTTCKPSEMKYGGIVKGKGPPGPKKQTGETKAPRVGGEKRK